MYIYIAHSAVDVYIVHTNGVLISYGIISYTPFSVRVDTVLGWFDLPKEKR